MIAAIVASAAFALPPATTAWEELQAEPKIECAVVDLHLWCRTYGTTTAGIDAVGAVIEDRPDYPKVYAHVAEVKAVDTGVFYTRIGMPAPFADRDQLFQAHRDDVDGARIYTWSSVVRADMGEVVGVVRLVDAAGEWRIEPAVGGGTSLRYTWCAEMGGSFPDWARWRAAILHATEMIDGTKVAAEARR